MTAWFTEERILDSDQIVQGSIIVIIQVQA